jgi:hypothetical protein
MGGVRMYIQVVFREAESIKGEGDEKNDGGSQKRVFFTVGVWSCPLS